MSKVCKKCGTDKPLDEYFRAGRGRLGREAQCKKCRGSNGTPTPFTADHKVCTKCKVDQPLSSFVPAGANRTLGGVTAWCRTCVSVYRREWRKTYVSPVRARNRQEVRYNLSAGGKRSMYEAQQGRCDCCKEEFQIDLLHIDHDHACCVAGSCGECIRALLCRPCNTMIGWARDSVERLQAGIEYLRTFQT